MAYKINQYEFCEHIVSIENDQENIIGFLFCFDGGFRAAIRGIEVDEFFLSDEKQEAIDSIIKTYENVIKNRKQSTKSEYHRYKL